MGFSYDVLQYYLKDRCIHDPSFTMTGFHILFLSGLVVCHLEVAYRLMLRCERIVLEGPRTTLREGFIDAMYPLALLWSEELFTMFGVWCTILGDYQTYRAISDLHFTLFDYIIVCAALALCLLALIMLVVRLTYYFLKISIAEDKGAAVGEFILEVIRAVILALLGKFFLAFAEWCVHVQHGNLRFANRFA